MQAWTIRANGPTSNLSLTDGALPSLATGDVRVAVHAAALNPADLKVLSGKNGGRFLHARKFPLTLGFDFSGVVEEVGPGLNAWQPGDEVFGFLPYSSKTTQGSFAQKLVARQNWLGRKPGNVSHAEAAAVATVGCTALQSLCDKGRLKSGQRVLINGASGGVGALAVQIAKLLGAEVWGTCSASNLAFVKGLGADHAIDYRETSVAQLDARFDVVLDAASMSSYGECRPVMAPGAVYVTLLPSLSLVTGLLRSLFSSRSCRILVVGHQPLGQLGTWLGEGKLKTEIARTFPFTEVPLALETLAAGGARGKLAVMVASA